MGYLINKFHLHHIIKIKSVTALRRENHIQLDFHSPTRGNLHKMINLHHQVLIFKFLIRFALTYCLMLFSFITRKFTGDMEIKSGTT